MDIEARIDRLIDITARAESGGDYSKWTPDDNGHGPSFGIIQFNATVGSLGKLIVMMREAKPEWWVLLFADSSPPLEPGNQDHAKAWGQAVAAGSPSYWRALLQLSGQVPIWQQCQRQLAREEYFDPAARLCAKFGLVSERAHAMAFDVAVQYGVGGLEGMLDDAWGTSELRFKRLGQEAQKQGVEIDWAASEPILLKRLAKAADSHPYDQNRRHKLLESKELSDEPMFLAAEQEARRPTLRRYSFGPEVIELREALESTGNLPPDRYSGSPTFSYAVEKAVKAFQAEHGLTVDGVVGPATWRALDEAAKGGKP